MSGAINSDKNSCEDLDSFDSDFRAGALGRPSLGNAGIGLENTR